MNWQLLSFAELSVDQLYELLKLRVNVFVVEQDCAYAELDEKDRHPQTMHLLAFEEEQLCGYSRIIPPGVSYLQASIGRVAVAAEFRNKGVAKQLMLKSIETTKAHWPTQGIQIGAQEYLSGFYQQLGFEAVSEVYLEDGIPHLDMRLN